MILILAIILFIIFLIYSIRPRKSEEYTLEGLKLSWLNKAGIEGVVTKWIVTLKDSSGSIIHTHENSDAGNLKDFTCLLYTSPSPRDGLLSRMPSSA